MRRAVAGLRGGFAQRRLCGAVLAAAVALGAAQGAAAQDRGSWTLGGSVEAQAQGLCSWTGDAAPWESGTASWKVLAPVLSAVSLNARGPSGPVRASGSAAVELGLVPGADGFTTRLSGLWAKLDWGWASLEAGRQPLVYGRGQYWSPVDLYAAMTLSGLLPARLPADALRLRLPFGDTGMADLVAAAPSGQAIGAAYAEAGAAALAAALAALPFDPAAWKASLRVSGLVAPGLDAGILVARDGLPADLVAAGLEAAGKAAWRLGADFKADLGASLYGEALLSMPEPAMAEGDWSPARLRASGGADWSAGDFVMTAEYYWNGGLPRAADPWRAGDHNVHGAVVWRGLDYVLLTLDGSWGLSDGSGSLLCLVAVDAAQDASLGLFAKAGRAVAGGTPAWSVAAGLDLTVKF